MSGIEVQAVSKAFGTTRVLGDVSLAIAPGEFVSLVGPSGCGKTTLLRIIAGLETPDRGRISIDDRDVTAIRSADRDVAMVFQNYALYPHLTVQQNISVPLIFRHLGAVERVAGVGRLVPGTSARRREIVEAVDRAGGLLGLDTFMARKPAQLSGGQRQRVALARAIVRRPKAFLMDEPLSNLDAALRIQTRKEIVDIHRGVGAATVYVTHDQSEAMTMSDRVAVMMAGDVLQFDTPEAIYADPGDLQVARFIGSPAINIVSAVVGDDGVVTVGGTRLPFRSAARGAVTLAVRPEAVAPAAAGLEADIEHVEFLGDSVLVHARLVATGETVIVRGESALRASLPRGSRHKLRFVPSKVLLFDMQGRRIRDVTAASEVAHD